MAIEALVVTLLLSTTMVRSSDTCAYVCLSACDRLQRLNIRLECGDPTTPHARLCQKYRRQIVEHSCLQAQVTPATTTASTTTTALTKATTSSTVPTSTTSAATTSSTDTTTTWATTSAASTTAPATTSAAKPATDITTSTPATTSATIATTTTATDVEDIYAESCQVMKTLQPGSGVRKINDTGMSPAVSAYCDQDTDDGGWTVIQRRQDGSVNFNRSWTEYQAGFGDPAGEYWLGLEIVHKITARVRHELRFDLQLYNGTTGFIVYSNFSVGPGSDFYRLSLGAKTSGNLYEHFSWINGASFGTWDMDNDNMKGSCAAQYGGGWWHGGSCSMSSLNGYYTYSSVCPSGLCVECPFWYYFGERCFNSLQKTAMKIRRL